MADFTEIENLLEKIENLEDDLFSYEKKVDDRDNILFNISELVSKQAFRIRLHDLEPEYTYLELIDEVLRLVRAS